MTTFISSEISYEKFQMPIKHNNDADHFFSNWNPIYCKRTTDGQTGGQSESQSKYKGKNNPNHLIPPTQVWGD